MKDSHLSNTELERAWRRVGELDAEVARLCEAEAILWNTCVDLTERVERLRSAIEQIKDAAGTSSLVLSIAEGALFNDPKSPRKC